MGEFHRSPSKVWWPDEYSWARNISASPGSQDSGFSDTETSPPAPRQPVERNGETPKRNGISRDILKNTSDGKSVHSQNLLINFKQKFSPKKSIALQFSEAKNTSDVINYNKNTSLFIPRTPLNESNNIRAHSEPTKRHRFHRNGSLKVSRSLFKSSSKQSAEHTPVGYQYAREISDAVESQYSNTTNSKVKLDDSQLWKSDDNCVELPEGVKTFPLENNNYSYLLQRNRSAPAILPFIENNHEETSLTREESLQSSDCESELESAFHGLLNLPKYTSTPKTTRNFRNMKHHRSKRIARLINSHSDNR